jgi:hypothetical protein
MTRQPTDQAENIDALALVRTIRDAQVVELGGMTPDEIVAYFHLARLAAQRDSEEWAKLHGVPPRAFAAA